MLKTIMEYVNESVLLTCITTADWRICDPLSENLALTANIKFELEAILSVQVAF